MPGKEIISKTFYSNCLIEAVKAKLKDWNNITIKRIPAYINLDKGCHYYWVNKKEDQIYEFYGAKEDSKNHFFFKGNIVKTSKNRNKILLDMGIKRFIESLEKKLDFVSLYTENEKELRKKVPLWEFYDSCLKREEFTKDNPYPYVLGCYKKDDKTKIGVYKIAEEKGVINPNNDPIDYWKRCAEELPYKNE